MRIGDINPARTIVEGVSGLSIHTPYNRYLWYGDYGCGKTHLIGTIHELLRGQGYGGVYIADFDAGTKTLVGREGCEDVEFDIFYKGDWLKLKQQLIKVTKSGDKYSCIAIDSLTLLQDAAMIYGQTELDKKRLRRMSAEKIKDKRHLGFVPNIQDYGIALQVLTRFLRVLHSLSYSYHVILTAHLLERENARTGLVEMLPNVMGKRFPSSIGLWFNEVWKLSLELDGSEKVQDALTFGEGYYKCKSQTLDMPVELDATEALKRSLGIYSIKDNNNNEEEEE